MAERNVDLIIRARDDAAKAFSTVSTALEKLTAIQKGVAFDAEKMGKALGVAEGDAEGLAAAISGQTKAAADAAEKGYKRVTDAVEKARTAMNRQQANLHESKEAYRALRKQQEAAAQAVENFRIRNEAAIDDRFKERLAAAEKGYKALDRAVDKASASLAENERAMEESTTNLNRLEQAAGLAEGAFGELQARLARQDARVSAQEQKELAAALRQSAQDTRRGAQEAQRLVAAYRQSIKAASANKLTVRDLTRNLTFMTAETDRAANGLRRNAAEMTNMRRALRAFYGDSRRALSLMQRIRGEVLSLTASFVGFYGVFRTGNTFLEAFNTLEAAQNRLSAAFGQNATRVEAEMAFLREDAKRLGIEFGVLADSYSKFVISGQQAGIETDKLRKVFRQVTEAGRVLKLSNDQIEGTLTALSQIAGKGTLQMEELRQQLGDRLPGAVGLVAQALGYAEDELADFYKAVENGQIDAESALVALGNGLEKTFGGQLNDALDATRTKLGLLQNLLFERSLTAANSGFIDGLETALDALNEFLESDEGIAFFEALGAAFGKVFELLPGILENIDLIVLGLKAFVAIKAAQVVAGLAGNFASMGASTVASRRQLVLFNRALAQVSPAMGNAIRGAGLMGVALRGLRGAMFATAAAARAVFASLGGPIGIAVAALSYFAFDGLGQVDEATQRLDKTLRDHEETLSKIRGAYLRAKDGATDWKEELKDLTDIEVEAQLVRLRKELAEYRKDEAKTFGDDRKSNRVKNQLLGFASNNKERGLIRALLESEAAFKRAELSAEEYRAAILNFKKIAPDLLPVNFLDLLLEVANGGIEIEEAITQAEAALRLMNGTATEADEILLGLKDATNEAAEAGAEAEKAYDGYAAAMRKLSEHVPELKKQLDSLDATAKIAQDFEDALAAIEKMPAALQAAARAQAELVRDQGLAAVYAGQVSNYNGTVGADVAASFIRDQEGFRNTPYWDVNAYRAGYGSDTVTLADGTIKKVTEGMYVSAADANRDLLRRITTEFMPAARGAVGPELFDQLNAQQQAALTSLAYNYGAGAFDPGQALSGVAEAVMSGVPEAVAESIRALGGHNEGVNRGRRNREAALFTSNAGVESVIEAEQQATEKAVKDEEKRLENIKNFNDQVERRIANAQFELSIQDLELQDREVAKALRQAELEAQKAGTELSKEQREEIEKVTRAKFAQQALDEKRNKRLEEAQKLEEQINLLQERRRHIKDQIALLEGNGDLVGAANAQEELAAVDEQLGGLIDKAIAFWQALGGEGSESALQSLEFAKTELRNIENQVVTTGRQMNDFFADAATAAIDRFAQRVANGENALRAFADEFRRMAAEILIEIGKMIVRQAIFNAISGMFGGGASGAGGLGGQVAGLINGLFHGGGLAGGASQTRTVNPAVFANAVRYHTGGIAGFAPDEVGAVLRKGEEVLTEADPRHRFNGGRMPQNGKGGMNIINAVDSVSFLEAALAQAAGGEVFMNFIKANQDEVKAVLG